MGAFPTWLSPEQVRILPISEKFNDYAQSVLGTLQEAGVRAHGDLDSEKIGAKIRLAQIAKVPYMLIVGAKEADTNTVSVRHRSRGDEGSKSLNDFTRQITQEIQSRSL